MIWSWNEVCYSGTPKSWIRRWRTSRKLWWSTSLKTWRRNTRILWVMSSLGHPSLGRDANLGEKSYLTFFLVVEASCEWEYDCKLCLNIHHILLFVFLIFAPWEQILWMFLSCFRKLCDTVGVWSLFKSRASTGAQGETCLDLCATNARNGHRQK